MAAFLLPRIKEFGMNGRIAHKIRQANRRGWRAYLKDIKALPFGVRFRLSWWLLFGDKRKA